MGGGGGGGAKVAILGAGVSAGVSVAGGAGVSLVAGGVSVGSVAASVSPLCSATFFIKSKVGFCMSFFLVFVMLQIKDFYF